MTRRHIHTYENVVDVRGLVGAGRIAFGARIPHGKGEREVYVCVKPEALLRLAAEIITAGAESGHEVVDQSGYVHRDWHVGHAVYHAEHSGFGPGPCSGCAPVDDEALRVAAYLRALAGPREKAPLVLQSGDYTPDEGHTGTVEIVPERR